VGLINYNETETPPLVREFKRLKQELKEIEKQLSEMED